MAELELIRTFYQWENGIFNVVPQIVHTGLQVKIYSHMVVIHVQLQNKILGGW